MDQQLTKEIGLVAIVGPGAVGTALGGIVSELGGCPYFVGRPGIVPHAATLVRGAERLDLRFAAPSREEALSATRIVFVTVKAPDVAASVEHGLEAGLWSSRAPIVVLANGAVDRVVAALESSWPDRLFRRGLVTIGVRKDQDGNFHVAGREGQVVWGPRRVDDPVAAPIEKTLTEKSPTLVYRSDAAAFVQRKWLFNTALNSLCGALQLASNGEALGHEGELKALFAEAFRLGEELWGPWRLAEDDAFRELVRLIHQTAANENSMARDVRLGRPTETAFLAGAYQQSARPDAYPGLARIHRLLDSK